MLCKSPLRWAFSAITRKNSNPALRNKRKVVWKAKGSYYYSLWKALTGRRWDAFSLLLTRFQSDGLNDDEVTYTLRAHQFLLNPHKPTENAFMVLEEMKRALVHPAIIRINEHLLNSYVELSDLACEPPRLLFQNFTKMALHCALKLNRQRRHKLTRQLLALDQKELLAITRKEIGRMALEEFTTNLSTPLSSIPELADSPILVNTDKFNPITERKLDLPSQYQLQHLLTTTNY